MPSLSFCAIRASILDTSAVPAVGIELELTNATASEVIHSVLLRTQIQIEAPRRRYRVGEQTRLTELFGEPAGWGRTLKPLQWATVTNVVGPFQKSIVISVVLPCTIDFHAAFATYFDALEDGTVPLTLLFSGTIFYQTTEHSLQAAPLSWNSEARFPFPVKLWKQCVEQHYGNTIWMPVRRDLYDLLRETKARQGLTSLDEVVEHLVARSVEVDA